MTMGGPSSKLSIHRSAAFRVSVYTKQITYNSYSTKKHMGLAKKSIAQNIRMYITTGPN